MSTMDIQHLIKGFSAFDVKKLNAQNIQSALFKWANTLVNTFIVIMTIVIISQNYQQTAIKTKEIKQKMDALEKKVQAIARYTQAQNDLKQFRENLPQGSSDAGEIMTKVTEIAARYNIQILSFSPTPKSQLQSDYYISTNIQINILSSRYEDAWLFVRDLEESQNNLRIGKWSMAPQAATNQRLLADKSEDVDFIVNLEVVSIEFKK